MITYNISSFLKRLIFTFHYLCFNTADTKQLRQHWLSQTPFTYREPSIRHKIRTPNSSATLDQKRTPLTTQVLEQLGMKHLILKYNLNINIPTTPI